MKSLKTIHLLTLVLVLSVCLAGCATTNLVEGRDFDASVTNQIVKGKTTTDEIITMLGQPYSKMPQADANDTVRWTYSYITATAHAQSGFFGGMSTTTSGHKKNLYIIINKNNVVENFTLDEGPIQQSTRTNSF
jgi:outer membrane protein assembly factor BamE (lipoprotein component of BamABCDE complex)